VEGRPIGALYPGREVPAVAFEPLEGRRPLELAIEPRVEPPHAPGRLA